MGERGRVRGDNVVADCTSDLSDIYLCLEVVTESPAIQRTSFKVTTFTGV